MVLNEYFAIFSFLLGLGVEISRQPPGGSARWLDDGRVGVLRRSELSWEALRLGDW